MKYAVYGTLRKNKGNYKRLLEGKSTFIETKTLNGYDMYSLGGFPGVVPGNGKITVDVFEIKDPKIESKIDLLEGYDGSINSMYLKKLHDDMYIYIWNGSTTDLKKIKTGNWL